MTEDTPPLLQQWLTAEREAVQAELKVAEMGQGAADPRVAALFSEAREKRMKADALFHEFYKRPNKPTGQPES